MDATYSTSDSGKPYEENNILNSSEVKHLMFLYKLYQQIQFRNEKIGEALDELQARINAIERINSWVRESRSISQDLNKIKKQTQSMKTIIRHIWRYAQKQHNYWGNEHDTSVLSSVSDLLTLREQICPHTSQVWHKTNQNKL